MAQTKTAKYKRYNGTDWDTIHFETDASVVSPTTSKHYVTTNTKVNGVGFTLDGSDGTKSTLTLYAVDIAVSSTDSTKISAALSDLGSRLTAIELAFTGGASGSVLTSENYAATLGSVYQAKDEDLTAIAGLTGTTGLLKKTAANTWTLDTTAYITQAAVTNAINALDGVMTGSAAKGKTLTAFSQTDGKVTATFGNIEITKSQVSDFPTTMKNPNSLAFGSDSYDGSSAKTVRGDNTYIANGNTKTVKAYIDEQISQVAQVANGKTKTYVMTTSDTIDLDMARQGYISYYYEPLKRDFTVAELEDFMRDCTIGNAAFASNNDSLPVFDGNTFLIVQTDYPVNDAVSRTIISTLGLPQGTQIILTDKNYPDRWATSVGLFYANEAKTDLTPYAQKATVVSSNDTDKGVKVTLGGTVNSPTVDVEVTGGSVTNGNGSVVTGGTVYNAVKDLAPKNNPTFTGTVTMPTTAGILKSNANGVVSVDTNTYLTAHPTITTSSDTTPSGTLTHGGTFTAVTGITRDSNGHVTTIATKTYTLPSDNNTQNTAGASEKASTKMFLVGATSQATGTTYSNQKVYIGTDNCIYSNNQRVPTIFYADTVPTSGMVTGDICIEY